MFFTITNTQQPIRLESPIDNKSGNLKIGLKSITMWVGYYNVQEKDRFKWVRTGEQTMNVQINPGLYSFYELAKIFTDAVPDLALDVNTVNGLAELFIPENIEIQLPQQIKNLLGLQDKGWLQTGEYVGDDAVSFLPKILHVNLEELSTTNNIVDGKPSQLLELIPLSSEQFGYSTTVNFPHPSYKQLQTGDINEFNVDLFISGKVLNNHNQPIYLTFEII
jgi:hypothetical protein